MLSLIIDTSGDSAFVAVAQDGLLISYLIVVEGRQLSKFLLTSIQTILQARTPIFIAIGIGPGSFTGTKIGALVAQTLAYAWKIPLVPFSSILLPDLDQISLSTYEKYLSGATSSQIELVYISRST